MGLYLLKLLFLFFLLTFLRLKMHFTPQYRVAVLTEILKNQNVNLALLLPCIILPTYICFFSVSSVDHFSSNDMLLPSLS